MWRMRMSEMDDPASPLTGESDPAVVAPAPDKTELRIVPRRVVVVRMYGIVRDVVGKGVVELDLDADATLADLFKRLVRVYGEQVKKRVLNADETIMNHVLVSLDGRTFGGEDSGLKVFSASRSSQEVVEVFVFPATAGG